MSKKSVNLHKHPKRVRGGSEIVDVEEVTGFPTIGASFGDGDKIVKELYKKKELKFTGDPIITTSSFVNLERMFFEKVNEGSVKYSGKLKKFVDTPIPEKKVGIAVRAKVIFHYYLIERAREFVKDIVSYHNESNAKKLSLETEGVPNSVSAQRLRLLYEMYNDKFPEIYNIVGVKKSEMIKMIKEISKNMKISVSFKDSFAAYIILMITDLMYTAVRISSGTGKKFDVGAALEVVRLHKMHV